jgi:choline dehydrogenase-like flavoprotein
MQTTFDYIIVGGGSAGCVMAARLSEDPSVTVALIESGGSDASNWVTMPAALIGTVPTTRMNWSFQTVPQDGLNGRKGYQPRGKVMGGSSSINAMCYIRGHASDYDEWAAAGCTGWSYADVLPYFKKSEGNLAGLTADFHGNSGPLKVSHLQSPSSFNAYFLKAAAACGYKITNDFNGAQQEGVGYYQVTQDKGVRCNAARAYLSGTESRSNLHIIQNTDVSRVVFEGTRAVGVTLTQTKQPSDKTSARQLTAQREVIVCAGAFGSPQLLMLSGVGPAAHLQSLGIPVVADIASVGSNLQDHADCLITRQYNDNNLMGLGFGFLVRLLSIWKAYQKTKTGMLTSNFAESGGFIRTEPHLAKPDVQWHFVVAKADNHGRNKHWGQGYAIHACQLRPCSRGTVRLSSTNAHDAPLIDPQYLSDPRDVAALIRAYKATQAVLQSAVFAPVRGTPLVPEPDVNDDAAIEQFIRDRADTIYHPVGTCRMGSDADSVVDLALRVRGVQGLRVVDASVMPTLIGGNTNAPTIMIAERAADLIKGCSINSLRKRKEC